MLILREKNKVQKLSRDPDTDKVSINSLII